MSVGAEPLTDEELAQLNAKFPNATADTAPILPADLPPVEGPPAPDFIDKVNDQPLPAGASTGAMPEPDNAWPPPVPAEAPGMVPVAPPIPGTTPAGVAAPVTAPVAAKTPKQTDELRAAQEEEAKARKESDEATKNLAEASAPAVAERKDIADQKVKQQQDAIKQQQKIQQRYQTAETAANDQIKQTQDVIKGFKFRDYFDDGKGGTDWARKVGASLSVALGAFGAGLTHGPNYALQILDKNMDDAHQHQVEQLNGMKDDEVRARTGLQDIGAARAKALADLGLNDAARDKLIAAQLDQTAAREKDATFAPGLIEAAAKLRLKAAEKESAAQKQLIDVNLKLQDEQRKGDETIASTAEKTSLAHLHDVQAAAGGYAPHHGKGAGTGGGGGVDTVGDNASALAKEIREGKDGKPLTDDEIIDAATRNHIPLSGKAGVTTLKTVREVAKFDADAKAKEKKGAIQSERIDNTEANAWAKQNGLDAINKKQRELGSLVQELKDAPENPLAQALAVEKAVSAARGGAASKQALGLALEHLGGSLDKAEGVIEKIRSGQLSSGQLKNFMGFIGSQLGTAQKEGKDKYDAFDKYVASQPEAKQQELLAQRGRLFSGMAGFGGGGSHAEQPVGATKVVGGKTYTKTGPGQWTLSP